jgi:Mg2+ and Co2+ transporter CorA
MRPVAIKALLYSADAPDQEPELASVDVARLSERELLWIDLSSPTAEELAAVARQIDCEPRLLAVGPGRHERPRLSNYGRRFRLTATAVRMAHADQKAESHWLTLVSGANYVVSVHEGGIDFMDELRAREKGDTGIGALSAESFVASLLDWLLNTYFQALEAVVREIDSVEVHILSNRAAPSATSRLVAELIQARRRVAEIRRLLISHRDVFYGLARPDFMATETPENRPHFIALNERLERAEDDVDHTRELVVGAFELLSMRAAQKTNDVMRALTFATVLLGSLALFAGVMGMNFELAFFHSGQKGFLIVTGMMAAVTVLAFAVAWWRKWL